MGSLLRYTTSTPKCDGSSHKHTNGGRCADVWWQPLRERVYVICRVCYYEKVAGDPCGLPCV